MSVLGLLGIRGLLVLGLQQSDNIGPRASDNWLIHHRLRMGQVGPQLGVQFVHVLVDHHIRPLDGPVAVG